MDMSAHPELLEALDTTADPEKARNRLARGRQDADRIGVGVGIQDGMTHLQSTTTASKGSPDVVRERDPTLALVVLLLGVWASTAAQASAAPAIPGVPDCKDAPAAQRPGDGLPASWTPRRRRPRRRETRSPRTRRRVSTSSTAMPGSAGTPTTWAVAASPRPGCGDGHDDRQRDAVTGELGRGRDQRAAQPDRAPRRVHGTAGRRRHRGQHPIKDAIWSPWGGAALLGVVMLLLWYSASGRIAAVTKAAGWAVLVLAVMAGVAQYPSRVSSFFDQTVTGTISQVNASTAGLAELPPTADPAKAQGALLVDRLALRLLAARGARLRRLGDRTEVGARAVQGQCLHLGGGPAGGRPVAGQAAAGPEGQRLEGRRSQVQDQDPSAYQALQGRSGNRTGSASWRSSGWASPACSASSPTCSCSPAWCMLRFLVMLFPAVAVLGVLSPMSSIVRRVANMAGASVVNVVSFAAGAAVHTTVISALLSRAQQGGMNLLVLVLCLVSTIAAFVLLFPLLSLTNVIGLSAGGRGVHALRRAGRLATRYGVTRKAVGDGEHDAGGEPGEEGSLGGGVTAGARSASAASMRYRTIQLPAESFGRPETQVGAAGPGGALAAARRPAASLPPASVRPGRAWRTCRRPRLGRPGRGGDRTARRDPAGHAPRAATGPDGVPGPVGGVGRCRGRPGAAQLRGEAGPRLRDGRPP